MPTARPRTLHVAGRGSDVERRPPLDLASPTAERILDAGERCMQRLGLRRFSMGDVASQARVSRGSVYRYFPEREALVRAILERAAERFVRSSEAAVKRRRTLAAQVAEAAVFIRQHLRDQVVTLYLPDEGETLLATLLSAKTERLLTGWVEFWQPYLEEAKRRGEIRPDLDRRAAAEWIVRIMLSFAVMPSVVVDLDDAEAVRAFVARYIVRGLAP